MCDCEISKFFKYHESLSHVNYGFITGMLTCHALGQLSIFKLVYHAEVRTHVNFLVS
jgi:hypothetical protein